MSQTGEFCWNELCTSNVNAAKEFYKSVFGWQFKELKSEDMTYTIIKCNDKEIAGMWQIPNDQQGKIPPHWMAYILVVDVAASLKKAKEHGATEIKGVTQVAGMGQFAIVTDPTGACFAMWETLSA